VKESLNLSAVATLLSDLDEKTTLGLLPFADGGGTIWVDKNPEWFQSNGGKYG